MFHLLSIAYILIEINKERHFSLILDNGIPGENQRRKATGAPIPPLDRAASQLPKDRV
jgi:hypothetical protein